MSKRIVILGTNHRAQAHYDEQPNELRNILRCLLMVHSGIQVIFEEWDPSGLVSTEGSIMAKENGLSWENVGTPDEPRFHTGGKLKQPPIPVVLCTYGPLENQIRREQYFLDRIKSIMSSRDHGLFVCGLSHIQSMGEKLLNLGFAVEIYEWQPAWSSHA
jgi:hypothetical protein